MTTSTDKNSNMRRALAASLIFHLAAFGAVAAMQPEKPEKAVKEYIQVDLAQLPPMPRYAAAAPIAAPAPIAAAPGSPKPAPAATVTEKQTPAPAPAPVQKIAAVPTPPASAPVSGPSIPVRAPAAAANGATSAGQPGGSGTGTPSRQGTGATVPGKRVKGDYLAFHRLSKLPSFRLRSEPVYPATERRNGAEARVLTEIYLDERGAVDDVVIKKSGGKLFDKAVIDAVRQSSFHPGYMGEKAVPAVVQIPYSFKLR